MWVFFASAIIKGIVAGDNAATIPSKFANARIDNGDGNSCAFNTFFPNFICSHRFREKCGRGCAASNVGGAIKGDAHNTFISFQQGDGFFRNIGRNGIDDCQCFIDLTINGFYGRNGRFHIFCLHNNRNRICGRNHNINSGSSRCSPHKCCYRYE